MYLLGTRHELAGDSSMHLMTSFLNRWHFCLTIPSKVRAWVQRASDTCARSSNQPLSPTVLSVSYNEPRAET